VRFVGQCCRVTQATHADHRSLHHPYEERRPAGSLHTWQKRRRTTEYIDGQGILDTHTSHAIQVVGHAQLDTQKWRADYFRNWVGMYTHVVVKRPALVSVGRLAFPVVDLGPDGGFIFGAIASRHISGCRRQ
jgi:hypothetical protein